MDFSPGTHFASLLLSITSANVFFSQSVLKPPYTLSKTPWKYSLCLECNFLPCSSYSSGLPLSTFPPHKPQLTLGQLHRYQKLHRITPFTIPLLPPPSTLLTHRRLGLLPLSGSSSDFVQHMIIYIVLSCAYLSRSRVCSRNGGN